MTELQDNFFIYKRAPTSFHFATRLHPFHTFHSFTHLLTHSLHSLSHTTTPPHHRRPGWPWYEQLQTNQINHKRPLTSRSTLQQNFFLFKLLSRSLTHPCTISYPLRFYSSAFSSNPFKKTLFSSSRQSTSSHTSRSKEHYTHHSSYSRICVGTSTVLRQKQYALVFADTKTLGKSRTSIHLLWTLSS